MSCSGEPYLDVYDDSPLVAENPFRGAAPDRSPPPALSSVRHLLPEPHWDGHAKALDCYWRVWELAFANLRAAHRCNGFVAPYIDTAFNDCLFQWDSCFILLFCRYGRRAFAFQRTLDNLYSKQHSDGFISREVRSWTGRDQFHRHDPASTGPNVFAWAEMEYYDVTGDRGRLARILPVLLAYHGWLRRWRTWPDGSYFSCGLACGMDNQPRTVEGCSAWTHHSYMAWIDATAQALLSARLLLRMAAELGHAPAEGSRYGAELRDCAAEVASLAAYIQTRMWSEPAQAYADLRLRATPAAPSPVRSIGAYWALLADAVPPERVAPFVAHLDDPAKFNRPLRVPSLAASDPGYAQDGAYWRGGVWAPTTYMVLRGLTRAGADDVAADIGRNCVEGLTRSFAATGTVWENMAPELPRDAAAAAAAGAPRGTPVPGNPAKPDFVGWSGLGPVAVLFEYVFGLRADVPAGALTLDVRLLDGYGVKRYAWGEAGSLDIAVASRGSFDEPPRVSITLGGGLAALTLLVRWGRRSTAEGGFRPDRSEAAAGALRQARHELRAGGAGGGAAAVIEVTAGVGAVA